MRVSLQHLTSETFAGYGQVLNAPSQGHREDFAAKVENKRASSARANLALIAAGPSRLPLEIKYLERHAHSTQAFLPLSVGEYLVVVCADDSKGKPDLSTLRARQLLAEDFHRFDLLLAMDEANLARMRQVAPRGLTERAQLFLSFAPQTGYRSVPDPYYGGLDGFDTVLDLARKSAGPRAGAGAPQPRRWTMDG